LSDVGRRAGIGCRERSRQAIALNRDNYLVVSVVVSVVFLLVVPPPSGVAGVVVVFLSIVVVVSPVVLPSLVCDVFVSVLFSVVPFWLSQPMVNTPSTAIRTDAKNRFIFKPFPKEIGVASSPEGTIPAVRGFPFGCKRANTSRKKKADVAEHPEVFDHVGLPVNEPPGQSRIALHLVIRQIRGRVRYQFRRDSPSTIIVGR